MIHFSGASLLLFASSFFLEFLFLATLHIAFGYFLGRLVIASGFEIIPSVLDASFRIRRWKIGRSLLLFFYRAQRSTPVMAALTSIVGFSVVLFLYLGPTRFLVLAFLTLTSLNALCFIQSERRTVRRKLTSIRSSGWAPLGVFGTRRYWGTLVDGSFFGSMRELISLRHIKVRNLNSTSVGLSLLMIATLAGLLRADRVMSGRFQVTIHTSTDSMTGAIYASSDYGVLFWRKDDGHVFLFPNGNFQIEIE